MKTIEEREREYAESTWPNNLEKQTSARLGYRAGAIAMREDLMRFNNPEEVPPEGKMMLVKRKPDSPLPYDLAYYNGIDWIDSWCGLIIQIDGWREIE